MTKPKPMEWLFIYACTLAAQTAAYAPLFGNDPAHQGAVGCTVGLLTGLPVYVAVRVRAIRRHHRP